MTKGNYRPITVLSAISKVYERVMSEQIVVYSESFLFQYLFFYIDMNYYNKNVTFYHTYSNYYTTLQGRYHGERKNNDYPMANKKTRNIKLTNNYTTI